MFIYRKSHSVFTPTNYRDWRLKDEALELLPVPLSNPFQGGKNRMAYLMRPQQRTFEICLRFTNIRTKQNDDVRSHAEHRSIIGQSIKRYGHSNHGIQRPCRITAKHLSKLFFFIYTSPRKIKKPTTEQETETTTKTTCEKEINKHIFWKISPKTKVNSTTTKPRVAFLQTTAEIQVQKTKKTETKYTHLEKIKLQIASTQTTKTATKGKTNQTELKGVEKNILVSFLTAPILSTIPSQSGADISPKVQTAASKQGERKDGAIHHKSEKNSNHNRNNHPLIQGHKIQTTTVEQQPLVPTSAWVLQPPSRWHVIFQALYVLPPPPSWSWSRGRRGTINTSEKENWVEHPGRLYPLCTDLVGY